MFLWCEAEDDEEFGVRSVWGLEEPAAGVEERLPWQQEGGGVCFRRPLCDWTRESGNGQQAYDT